MSNSNAIANGVAGAGAGIIAQILTYPLQTVNTRQQTERIAKSKPKPPTAAAGTLLQILHVLQTEGWGGLYSGLKPSLFGTAASQGIYYYFYQLFKNKAEAIAVVRKHKGRGDGTLGIFSWLVVAALAGFLSCLSNFLLLEQKIDSEKVFLLGALAKLGATVTTYPLLVVKSRLQAKQEIGGNISLRYSGTVDAIIKMMKYEGLPGFYKGMSTKIVQSVFAASVLFMFKEEIVKAYIFLVHRIGKAKVPLN
ncbi:hypothetical protein GOBAR_AA18546 [Gossypium barbadense]|uniref:Uncharacterized protein n=1 Tax=Gossypium barbadense TaxID=3634 RepID=A0A2P5XFN4_GOSBA|nr:hypothetical protein GOBAR_AA18546 [Gossypium barbadense]